MASTNKDGQTLGRKGVESRTRLLEATRRLISENPSGALTATAVARAAGLASQTFYLYFASTEEVLLQLSREASDDVGEIAQELDGVWEEDALHLHAERVVSAFYRYWDRHRAILHLRNYRADGGQEAFVEIRNQSSMPLVVKMAARIRAAQGEHRLTEQASIARAVIIFSAIERMAARYASIPGWRVLLGSEDLKQAEADILALLISPDARADG